ncbi:creatinine amidohydrolase [Parabacteroides sp. PF5-5]|uniref:creatininase family protein n=1 Tax=unclassified Parabacteroides TaxID=2649774 RepID=UPI0024772337|nr:MULTISPECIES: creatininase family protein [unclassified Parabacteroides]MDH6304701.1 creatinine amidohydrolase [Parabacteroides sp. PH5-39]MDH6315684.1 creatinine amidohydrolase [Parabacteroides sp. PF5-13]MDH6319345.1 creatinine amidohydrolase [Parabacteroides sp. PH5-13]MDH6323076.1 creatinine amidohydrolase [Parabacteroides sp. PH5-8]MDH6326877.1 creatinine amidohydrolase [Parabacteroides sp. PH5-41]
MKQLLLLFVFLFSIVGIKGQNLPIGWEELTAPDFKKAVELSEGVCVIPMGVVEKHGPHLPLGTDVYTAREVSKRAASKEYCIVYPYYFVGQIFEAQQQPGTIAYSSELIYKMLDETCREISRNGIKKIILMNSHGGNTTFLQYFCQTQLDKPKDYVVYLFTPSVDAETQKKISSMRKSTTGGHADEVESSSMMAIRPDLVKINQATSEPGVDMNRLQQKNVYTGIWWYAKYPNHYAGDSKDANAELGEISLEQRGQQLAEVIKMVKADQQTLKLQNEFFKETLSPLNTPIRR